MKTIKKITTIAACSVMMGSLMFPELGNYAILGDYSITASAEISTSQNLKVGSRGTQVKYLQMNLNALNYNAGSVDGIFGNGTKNAVIRFQKAYGLSADGIAGKNTINKMNSVVKQLQNDLNSLGYNCGTADGILGTNSINAIKRFQRTYGLSADGIVGPQTMKKLNTVKNTKKQDTSNTLIKIKLNFNNAYQYAKKYWNKRNYNYNYYNGNNCANFVSQCLVSAGMPTSNTWKNGTYAFINTTGLRNYFVNNYKVTYKSRPKTSDISVGDVIYTNNGGHVMFVMSKSGNTIKASGNTNNRDCITVGINGISGVLKTSSLF